MIEIRPATERDLESEYQVFVSAEGEVWQRHGLEWRPPPFEEFGPLHRHLLQEDGDRGFVAVDGDAVVAYTAAFARGDVWFFAALFVLPAYQRQGLGQQLLDQAWTGSFARRITITDSFQPASNGLYARRGLIPTTPVFPLTGTSACEPVDALVACPSDPDALAAIDRAAYGFDRAADHRFWQEEKGAPTLWLRADEPVGYAYTAASGHIGPLAAHDPAAAADVLRAELARRNNQRSALVVPGTARELVTAALDAGLRFSRPPGLLLLSEGCPAPTGLAISGYFLY